MGERCDVTGQKST